MGLSYLRGPKTCQNCGTMFSRRIGQQQWDRTNHCTVKCAKAEYKKSPQDRILDGCIPEPNSGCWLWLGTETQWGYAQVMVRRGVSGFAHRYSYEAFKGPIPDGLLACHTCDNRMCVNPDHLYAGTHQDNSDDAVRRVRLTNNFTREDILRIRSDPRPGLAIAKEYGVSKTAIYYIKNRQTWQLVNG